MKKRINFFFAIFIGLLIITRVIYVSKTYGWESKKTYKIQEEFELCGHVVRVESIKDYKYEDIFDVASLDLVSNMSYKDKTRIICVEMSFDDEEYDELLNLGFDSMDVGIISGSLNEQADPNLSYQLKLRRNGNGHVVFAFSDNYNDFDEENVKLYFRDNLNLIIVQGEHEK
ncbi:hypothetical protein [Lachnospira multipara]|uniref:Uncharacterized protein n=1 Tax=Lachnospira multipara TaxID=28051 RepID=A0A1H5SWE4_9FIRM|nr:hypothetical protein [Lachnospira multipara]SEF54860.1 hypothetical protein SAMN05216537_103169 [Lachnospira multipara]